MGIHALLAGLGLALLTTPADAGMNPGHPTVLITGSNRGIGLELVRQFSQRDWNVIATARNPQAAEKLRRLAAGNDRIVIEKLDVTDDQAIAALAEKYRSQPIDILLNNAGLTPKNDPTAFKRLADVDFTVLEQSFRVNALGPLKMAQAFMDHVAASEQKKIITLASKAGSFALSPKMAMMYGYRGSKAAVNMYMYTLSFEAAKRGVIVTVISPGRVNTVISGPRQPNSIEPEESVTKMMKVIESLTPEHNGKFLNYENGEQLAW